MWISREHIVIHILAPCDIVNRFSIGLRYSDCLVIYFALLVDYHFSMFFTLANLHQVVFLY